MTKVVQRISVRVDLEPEQQNLALLRPGMSSEARINTHGATVHAYGGSPLRLDKGQVVNAER
jgi:membrane fusion protein (multidrug efflux system)